MSLSRHSDEPDGSRLISSMLLGFSGYGSDGITPAHYDDIIPDTDIHDDDNGQSQQQQQQRFDWAAIGKERRPLSVQPPDTSLAVINDPEAYGRFIEHVRQCGALVHFAQYTGIVKPSDNVETFERNVIAILRCFLAIFLVPRDPPMLRKLLEHHLSETLHDMDRDSEYRDIGDVVITDHSFEQIVLRIIEYQIRYVQGAVMVVKPPQRRQLTQEEQFDRMMPPTAYVHTLSNSMWRQGEVNRRRTDRARRNMRRYIADGGTVPIPPSSITAGPSVSPSMPNPLDDPRSWSQIMDIYVDLTLRFFFTMSRDSRIMLGIEKRGFPAIFNDVPGQPEISAFYSRGNASAGEYYTSILVRLCIMQVRNWKHILVAAGFYPERTSAPPSGRLTRQEQDRLAASIPQIIDLTPSPHIKQEEVEEDVEMTDVSRHGARARAARREKRAQLKERREKERELWKEWRSRARREEQSGTWQPIFQQINALRNEVIETKRFVLLPRDVIHMIVSSIAYWE